MAEVEAATLKVDSHFHVWDLQRFKYLWPTKNEAKIFRNFLPQDYKQEMANTPIHHAVFVEAQESTEETKWALNFAEEFDFLKGVVGFVDLTSADLENEICEFKENPKFVGVRKILDLSEEGWLERDNVIGAMEVLRRHNLTYDLLIRTRQQYESAKVFLRRVPSDLRIVLDHLGKPDARHGAEQWWYDDISEIASYRNVCCKLSGMVTEADLENWKPSDFKQHVEFVIEKFGVDRVMFGSDWPVCKMANTDLRGVYNLLETLLSDLSCEEKAKVFGENAIKFYNLNLNRIN